MTTYAIANLHNLAPHSEVAEYIELIQATLDPYGGRFLVHGGWHEVKEGSWDGAAVVIAFPGINEARNWRDSPAYRQIAPLRVDHIQSDIILVDGVPDGYDRAKTAAKMREFLQRPDSRTPSGTTGSSTVPTAPAALSAPQIHPIRRAVQALPYDHQTRADRRECARSS